MPETPSTAARATSASHRSPSTSGTPSNRFSRLPDEKSSTTTGSSVVGGSMTDRMYVSYEGGEVAVVVSVFEPVGAEAYRVEGSFEASLPFVPDPNEGADLENVVDLAGSFAIDRLPSDAYP